MDNQTAATDAREAVDPETIKRVQQGIGGAAWNMNILDFCKVLGWNPAHAGTQEKFKNFQTLGSLLGKFDRVTLGKLINAPRS